jgi:N-acetyl-anhydromuramyl-L-alanine amidase AmpD
MSDMITRAIGLIVICASLAFPGFSEVLRVTPYPIVTKQRLELTRSYCKKHYGLDSTELKSPQAVVIHATEIATLAATLKTFKPDTIDAGRRYLRRFDRLNVGVHFVVDIDGHVYSLLPLDVIGRHAIGLNHVSVGIENVGFSDHLTSAQVEADTALVEDLVKRLPTLRYLIGHHEYVDKSLPHYVLYKELAAGYRPTQKSDPGPAFMKTLRDRLAQRGIRLEP